MPEPLRDIISIRMYRGLLGDCFLLTHRHGPGGKPFRALIDCGVLQCIGAKTQTAKGVAHIDAVVADLAKETEGVLDLMVATHQHYDHLAGFILGFEVMSKLTIKALWLAWTEDRSDDLAEDLRARGRKALSTLTAFVNLHSPRPGENRGVARINVPQPVRTVANLLQFYGELEDQGPQSEQAFAPRSIPPKVALDKKPRSIEGVIEWLKLKVGEKNVRYLAPGEVLKFGIDDRLTANVLGPPRTTRLLQLDPSAGANREVYLTTHDAVAALASVVKLRMADPAEKPDERSDPDQPFSARFRQDEAAREGFETYRLYKDRRSKTRSIEAEWMGSAEDLALKIDGDVNNTSLALAIETMDKQVLLFPADAQVGNWLSWHDQRYPKTDKPDVGETATGLLSRTIFYKVGHHGSHNATAREKGLELMVDPKLVAMIPVVQAVAREQKTINSPTGWAMPYPDLYARLAEKTSGRIVQGDGDIEKEARIFKDHPIFALTYAEGAEPLWAQLTLGEK